MPLPDFQLDNRTGTTMTLSTYRIAFTVANRTQVHLVKATDEDAAKRELRRRLGLKVLPAGAVTGRQPQRPAS